MARKPIILLLAAVSLLILASADTETDILLKFKYSLQNTAALSTWTTAKPPCTDAVANWVGVFCENGRVWGLQLQGMALEGVVDVDALAGLPHLRTLSLMNNNLDGPLPTLTRLSALKGVYLSNNRFSGEVPQGFFLGMLSLKKVYLANNKLSGTIPVSLATLPRLIEVTLENNEFVGEIPQFPSRNEMTVFSVAHNELVGRIPASVSRFGPSAFDGNADLCDAPFRSCSAPAKRSIWNLIGMVIVVSAALAALFAVVVILSRRRYEPSPKAMLEEEGDLADLDRLEKGESSPEKSIRRSRSRSTKKSEVSTKITFLRDDRKKFDMSDMLKASAEVLGSGVFGSTYKAALNGDMMVVKRFRYMNNVNKEEFHEHMRRLGKMSHPNIVPIVGFYYRREEKLLVSDYAENLSLAVQLHGNRSRNSPNSSSLDWPTRLKVIKGIGQGLLYLHTELPSLTVSHGHLKSSNVLLNRSWAPLLTDYSLVPIVNQEYAQEHMIAYMSPEYMQSGRITRKTDVWSFGVLVLEIMTGKYPSNMMQMGTGGANVDIVAFAEEAVSVGDNEVFDGDMGRREGSEGEMMKMVQIALDCCEAEVERRPDMKEAVRRIEEIKEE